MTYMAPHTTSGRDTSRETSRVSNGMAAGSIGTNEIPQYL
jgi:hypothetical protein